MDIIEDEYYEDRQDLFTDSIGFFRHVSQFFNKAIDSDRILMRLDIECFVLRFSELRRDDRSLI